MNFSMRNFIKSGFLKAVGKMGDYWVILNAAGWCDKGVLLEEDLMEIQSAIDARNATSAAPTESPSENEPEPLTESPSENEPEPPTESLSGDATPENM
ncbi:MAG: hypothetical protein IJQ81_00590 [Oscillibacter sp.]|nr:hypothetical protein [Oscillibacter sp.]